MKKFLYSICALCVAVSAVFAADPPREAAAILKDYEAVKEPVGDGARIKDQAYFRSYFAELMKALEKKDALALELFQAHPEHPQTIPLMMKRWSNMAAGGKGEKVREEVAAYLKDNPDTRHKSDLLYHAAIAEIEGGDKKKILAAIEEFIKVAPKDARGGELLAYAAGNIDDSAEQLKLYRRVVADYADSKHAAGAAGSIHRLEGIGKPFELSFEDAVTGKPVSMKALQGKIVVVDFWATWCGPCVAEMPTMKKLYAEHKDHGVEFVGVSLDNEDEGLDALKKYVKDNAIPWPQYYQGNGWESKFSMSWGINSIPALFVVDADGNLYSTSARGKLETMIPELIKKRGEKK
jgi:thiol-disulfide isomerase/thioredoxin